MQLDPTLPVAAQGALVSNLPRDLVVGIVSGIVTTVLLWTLGFLWKVVIQPWFEARVYRGIEVAGTWELENPLVDEAANKKRFDDDESVSLTQAAHRLGGTLTFTTPGAAAQRTTQDLTGEIRDRLVCFTTRTRSRKSIGYTCVLAEVSADGQCMTGHSVYYDLEKSKVDANEITYVRKA